MDIPDRVEASNPRGSKEAAPSTPGNEWSRLRV